MSHEDFKKELNALRENLPQAVEETASSKSVPQVVYSLDLGKRIVDFYSQGMSLQAIARKSEMPAYATLLKWSKELPEFAKMLRAVRESRAIHFEDSAIEAAENAQGKDADRLKVDTYKWAAEVNDPATYGKKLAHSGEVKGSVVIQVVTGFGEPNEWQQPPKLKPDGTVDKTPIEVKSEVIDVPRTDEPRTDEPRTETERDPAPDGTQNDAPGDLSGDADGISALHAEQ